MTTYEVRWLGSRATDTATVLYSGPDYTAAMAIAATAIQYRQGHTYIKTFPRSTATPQPEE